MTLLVDGHYYTSGKEIFREKQVHKKPPEYKKKDQRRTNGALTRKKMTTNTRQTSMQKIQVTTANISR